MKIFISFLFLAILHITISNVSVYSQPHQHVPKNIIVMIGDGMGFEHIQASLYFQGNQHDNIWEQFPVKLAASTYYSGSHYNPQQAWSEKEYIMGGTTESAAAATAIATGFITAANHVGMDANANPLLNPVQIAHINGKASGIITSVPFNHATPAGFVAHNISRQNYHQIALDIIFNSHAHLIMGCGHPMYDNDGKKSNIPNYKYVQQEVWDFLKNEQTELLFQGQYYMVQDVNGNNQSDSWRLYDSKSDLQLMLNDKCNANRIFFAAPAHATLFESRSKTSEIPYDIPMNHDIPTLTEMTMAGLHFLSKNPNGFFLMIEGGAIDWASHDRNLPRMIEEQMDFENAVEYVHQWISDNQLWDETLLIVLADHECGYLCNGFDSKKGFQHVQNKGAGKMPGAIFLSENHTNHLVPFFAKGCGAAIFPALAKANDKIRGQYLHMAAVAHAIKLFWGNYAFAFPQHFKTTEKYASIHAAAPCIDCEYQWFVNNTKVDNANSATFTYAYTANSKVYAIANCCGKTFQTNTVNIQVKK
jgi:alkaline phosphatase